MIPLNPSRSVFMEQAAAANVVPVWTEIVADGDTPVSAFAKIGARAPSFLLESAEQSDQVGRYSFLGAGARLMISARDKIVTVTENGKIRTFESARDPLDELQKIMARYRVSARSETSGLSWRRGWLSRLRLCSLVRADHCAGPQGRAWRSGHVFPLDRDGGDFRPPAPQAEDRCKCVHRRKRRGARL